MEERCNRLQESVEARSLDGVEMPLYVINGHIAMAGQPQPTDWQRLAAAGYNVVVNIRSDTQRAAAQAQTAASAGLRYVHLPLPVYELEMPHLAQFHDVLEEARRDGGKVLFHCRTASRTALLWLLNRVVYEGWPQAEAEAELSAAGYSPEDMEVFQFCAEDYLERVTTAVAL